MLPNRSSSSPKSRLRLASLNFASAALRPVVDDDDDDGREELMVVNRSMVRAPLAVDDVDDKDCEQEKSSLPCVFACVCVFALVLCRIHTEFYESRNGHQHVLAASELRAKKKKGLWCAKKIRLRVLEPRNTGIRTKYGQITLTIRLSDDTPDRISVPVGHVQSIRPTVG